MPTTATNSSGGFNERQVFVNVPYDVQYGPLFTAVIASLVGLGFIPRCGLESGGRERLRGIFQILSCCGASVHDLSRMDLSGGLKVPRFNMPFELGMAYALQSRAESEGLPQPSVFVFAEKKHIKAALSDVAGFDPVTHRGTSESILKAILGCFEPLSGPPDDEKLTDLLDTVAKAARGFQKKQRTRSPFHFRIFKEIVAFAVRMAREEGLLAAGSPSPHSSRARTASRGRKVVPKRSGTLPRR